MRIDHSHGDEKTVVGDSVEAYAAVIVRNIFYQPVDRVVGVRAFVDSLGVALLMQRAKHDELTFGAIAAANILKRKDIALPSQVRVAIDHVADALVRTGNSVGRPAKENRQPRRG